jgi:hypothetical protein
LFFFLSEFLAFYFSELFFFAGFMYIFWLVSL